MVLIDTSVWIRTFRGREPFRSQTATLVRKNVAVGHELVFGELLMGDCGRRKQFLREYELMPLAKRISHQEVVSLVRGHHLHGRGVGWIDVHLLASALVGRMRLWTADPRLAAVAEELSVGYKLSSD